MKENYLDVVANAFKEARAWKYACFVLTGICAGLTVGLVYEAGNAPTVLVPYEFATANGLATEKGPLTVQSLGTAGQTSPDYLSQVALGDLATVLNWTPGSVDVQHQRFLNRMTPELYAKQNVKMLTESAEFKSNSISESFYPSRSQIDVKQNQAVVDGTLVRWTGEKETLRLNVTYTITYAPYKGYLHVSGLRIENK